MSNKFYAEISNTFCYGNRKFGSFFAEYNQSFDQFFYLAGI